MDVGSRTEITEYESMKITGMVARDIRFPTSDDLSRSDALNEAPPLRLHSGQHLVGEPHSGVCGHLHEHFVDPVTMKSGRYMPPEEPGYSIEVKPASLDEHEFPAGGVWASR